MLSNPGRLKTIVNVMLPRTSDTRNFIDFSRITGVVWNLLHGIKVSEKAGDSRTQTVQPYVEAEK